MLAQRDCIFFIMGWKKREFAKGLTLRGRENDLTNVPTGHKSIFIGKRGERIYTRAEDTIENLF
jgi:hypothetical protein